MPANSYRLAQRTVDTAAVHTSDPLELLKELVAIPSVNPMGTEVSSKIYYEHRLVDWLVQLFQELDVPYELHEVDAGRCNIVARIDSPGATHTVMLDAHTDTVPVEGMTVPPFEPTIVDGRLYARGACDVKGGMAAMLTTFIRIAQERPYGCANVIMSCTCDEEFTAKGAIHLANYWQDPVNADSLIASPPDVCIVAEPTELHAIVAHKGVVRWTVNTSGVSCHSSSPNDGVNAIYKMGRLLTAIEQYAEELPTLCPTHPLCGAASISVGKVQGGTSVNIVPHECSIEIDRRLVPGEDPDMVIPKFVEYLQSKVDFDFEVSEAWVNAAPLSDENNKNYSDRLLEIVETVAGTREKKGAWYGTNASSFNKAGVPSIVIGPGSIAQAHTKDEWIEIQQLYQAAEVYYQFCQKPLCD